MKPVSIAIFARNVRRACIHTEGDVTSLAHQISAPPMTPWSVSVRDLKPFNRLGIILESTYFSKSKKQMIASRFASIQNTRSQSLSHIFFLSHPQGQRASECELGEWSQWSTCMKKNKTCGFRKGSQSRFRGPLLQVHSPDTTAPASVPSQTCSPQTERRKCTVTKIPCARGKRATGDIQ